MPHRRPLIRLLRWGGALCVGLLAVVGGLGMRAPGLISVAVAGVLAAAVVVGMARDGTGRERHPVVSPAVQAGAWTVALLLALIGLTVLAGGVLALLTGAIGALAWLAVRVARSGPRWPGRSADPAPSPAGREVLFLPGAAAEGSRPTTAERTSPVPGLPTAALGREWLRTSAALGGRLSAAERQALVRRRAETLDELERRDPAGFATWLAAGPAPGSDPSAYIRGASAEGDQAAGSDAA
ncbi:hypothetical protein [Blastococcus tunisiensis]|uniref:Uncharacterized protein n=1 Tax=Blastococcus tunisiensis TaxID=1798228 RepID=A0A1I1Y3E4_9ACTN|nr:hypothetical protein [Blastococcus sp. DSM 46838]SFE12593.1 hypothetical protein SAMN05216574_102216 [Blastococcus sp. DSM 46838]